MQEAQATLTLAPRWAALWEALTWTWVWGLPLTGARRELLLAFLRQAGGHQERLGLSQRIAQQTLAMVRADNPDWDQLSEMVRRVRVLGLPEDWWAVQNHLWDLGLRQGAGHGFAMILGFAS